MLTVSSVFYAGLPSRSIDQHRGDRFSHPFANFQRTIPRGIRKHYREFFAAEASDVVRGAQFGFACGDHTLEYKISYVMDRTYR
jgi:hypothetical protein